MGQAAAKRSLPTYPGRSRREQVGQDGRAPHLSFTSFGKEQSPGKVPAIIYGNLPVVGTRRCLAPRYIARIFHLFLNMPLSLEQGLTT